MPATVILNEWNDDGSSPTGVQTDKTSGTIRFKNLDDAVVDTEDPLVRPVAGSPSLIEHSFLKWIKLEITGGAFTQVDNIQAYSDGANGFGTGVLCYYWVRTQFVAPVIPAEVIPPVYDGSVGADFFTATSGARIDLDAGDPGPHTTTGHMGDFLLLMMSVDGTASQGLTPSETLTISYDEQ